MTKDQLLKARMIKEYPDGSIRYTKFHPTKPAGAFYERPPQTAPLFDSESGRAAGMKSANTITRRQRLLAEWLQFNLGLSETKAKKFAKEHA